jgi:hypothetical protein
VAITAKEDRQERIEVLEDNMMIFEEGLEDPDKPPRIYIAAENADVRSRPQIRFPFG